MSDVEVRAADDCDLPAVALLRWRWVVEGGGEAVVDRDAFVEAFVAWAARNAATHSCTVLVRESRVVGMAWLAVVPRVPSPRSLHRVTGSVQSVYVVPEERGHGWGGLLVRRVLDDAAALGLERVTVHSSERAVPVYEREGFASSPRLLQVPGDA